MRRITLLLVGMLALFSTTAQRKNFTYKFYGFVRGDLFYNSRANMAPIDGNFYLYPLDKSFDADGKDLKRRTLAVFPVVIRCYVSGRHT